MPDTLPLSTAPEAAPAPPAAARRCPPATAVEPLLVDARRAAALCGISPATWHRLRAAGKIGPAAVKLGGRVLWSLAELRSWIAAPRGPDGQLPNRKTWEALKAAAAQRNGRPR